MTTELTGADEVFLTGTGAEVTPVIKIDKKKVGNGQIGPITQQLQDIYFRVVHGNHPKYTHWITAV